MSNAFVGAATTQADVPQKLLIAALIWLVLSGLVAKALGVFRRGSIAGPVRIGGDESGWMLLYIFFSGYFIATFVGIAVSALCRSRKVNDDLGLLISTTAMEGTAFILLVASCALLRRDGLRRLGLQPGRLVRGILAGLATLFVLYPIVLVISQITVVILHMAKQPDPAPNEVLQFVTESHQRGIVGLAIFVAVVVAPFFEELAFRGFLQTLLSNLFAWSLRPKAAVQQAALPILEQQPTVADPILSYATQLPRPDHEVTPIARWSAVIITAVCFALVHRELAFMPPLFVLAVGLGYVYERTGNLWANIATHSLFNGLQIILVLSVKGN
jgi:membrane protease YdiL (CAAX protease family)